MQLTALLAAARSFSSLRPVMYTFAPLLSSVLARIRPRPEPPVINDFSYCWSWYCFLSNGDVPPVTTATRPSTSYRFCLLYLEAISKEFAMVDLDDLFVRKEQRRRVKKCLR